MKYEVILHKEAQKELKKIEKIYTSEAESDYQLIRDEGSEYVTIRFVRQGIYEIKSGKVRSLFIYKEKQIILIGVVFLKKTQKTPDKYIDAAIKRLK